MPTYPGLRLALPSRGQIARRIEQAKPDAIHIATEGPIGSCRARLLPAARPAVHDELHDAISRIHLGALADPGKLDLRGAAAVPRRRRRDDGGDAVADSGARASAASPTSACGRAASTPTCSGPTAPSSCRFPRPIFVSVGRVAVEKNLEAFLSLDLPGTKVVIGTGPQEAELKQRFPDAKFLGLLENGKLAAHLAAADVFVFPSRTDTFGVVQLEALASGVPVAAFPVTGPKDVIGNNPVGVLERGSARGLPRRAAHVRARPAATSRCSTPGKTARGSSSATSSGSSHGPPRARRTRSAMPQRRTADAAGETILPITRNARSNDS